MQSQANLHLPRLLSLQNSKDGYRNCQEEALRLWREVWGKPTTPPSTFFGSIAQVGLVACLYGSLLSLLSTRAGVWQLHECTFSAS